MAANHPRQKPGGGACAFACQHPHSGPRGARALARRVGTLADRPPSAGSACPHGSETSLCLATVQDAKRVLGRRQPEGRACAASRHQSYAVQIRRPVSRAPISRQPGISSRPKNDETNPTPTANSFICHNNSENDHPIKPKSNRLALQAIAHASRWRLTPESNRTNPIRTVNSLIFSKHAKTATPAEANLNRLASSCVPGDSK